MPNIRIKDVAKHAGVSDATITRVINNKGYVSEETRNRVLKSIDALEYIPNRMASALKNRRTGIIGNILSLAPDNPFFLSIAEALRKAAWKYEYQILPIYYERDRSREDRLLKMTLNSMAEGIIFTGDILSSQKAVKEVLNKGIPVIIIERPMQMNSVDKVLVDDFYGSSEAAEKFLSLGHKNFAFIGRELRFGTVEHNRLHGFMQTLGKNNIDLKEKMIVMTNEYSVECGYNAMKQIIRESGKHRPTACFIASDILACGALHYIYDIGLRIPDDISIIGYDNTLSALCSPPITSVALPYDEIGVTAISLLLERQKHKRSFDKTVTLSPFILDRGSVADLTNL